MAWAFLLYGRPCDVVQCREKAYDKRISK